MNFFQKLGLLALILISISYVYFSFFNKESIHVDFTRNELPDFQMDTDISHKEMQKQLEGKKEIKIFLLDDNGKIRSVNRTCDLSIEKSCFEYAIKELISAPSKWEKSKGFTSEIPQNTKILSIREDESSIRIDLSSDFEAGGGTESTYTRVHQLIKTTNSNTKTPTYLYINGKQVNVIGGDGIMIKQPLTERSLDE